MPREESPSLNAPPWQTRRSHPACLAAILLIAVSSDAATYQWDAVDTSNGKTIDGGSGTWNTAPENPVWNHGGVNSRWSQTSSTEALHSAQFGGVDGPEGSYAVTLETSVAVANSNDGLCFNATGYLLSAPAPRTITVSTITTADGKSAILAGSLSVTPNAYEQLTLAGRGTLRVRAGARLAPRNNLLNVRYGAKVVVEERGGISTTSQMILGNGNESPEPATMVVSGGSVLLGNEAGANGTANNLVLANGGSGVSSAVLTIDRGTVENCGIGRSNSGESGLRFGPLTPAASVSGTVNLNGGTLTMARIYEGNPGVRSTFNFNGGTLQVQKGAANAANFLSGLDSATVEEGGAIIDTNGVATTIAQALTHGGSSPVDGGLTKQGSGLLVLTGRNTYTGPTIVAAGTLALGSQSAQITSTTVRRGAKFRAMAGASAAIAGVTLEPGSAIGLDLGAYNPGNVASIVVSSFRTEGDFVVDLLGSNIPPGTYTILSYLKRSGSGNMKVGAVPQGLSATVEDIDSSIVVHVRPRQVSQHSPTRSPAG